MYKHLILHLTITILSTACGSAAKTTSDFPVTVDCLSASEKEDLQLLGQYFADYLSLAYADGATPTAIHYRQFGQETSEDLSLAHLRTAEAAHVLQKAKQVGVYARLYEPSSIHSKSSVYRCLVDHLSNEELKMGLSQMMEMSMSPTVVNGGYLGVAAFDEPAVQLMFALDVFYPLLGLANN